MSSPDQPLMVDDLFRQALAPMAEVSPPVGQWKWIADRIRGTSARERRAPAILRLLQVLSEIAQQRRALYKRKPISWLPGPITLYPVSAHDLVHIAPYGGFRPSPFAEMMVQRAWGLRLAS